MTIRRQVTSLLIGFSLATTVFTLSLPAASFGGNSMTGLRIEAETAPIRTIGGPFAFDATTKSDKEKR